MASDKDMEAWMKGDDKSSKYYKFGSYDSVNQMRNQFCWAISFEEQDSVNKKYSYNLRYNETGPERVDDHYDPGMPQYSRFIIEKEDWFKKERDSGLGIVMNMVDNFILQEALGKTNTATPDAYIKSKVAMMPIKSAKQSDL